MNVSPIDISASGMRAQRLRMEVIANNLANLQTTAAGRAEEMDDQGRVHVRYVPYRRKEVIFQAEQGDRRFGVSVPMVVDDPSDFRVEFNPSHPHAVKNPSRADFGRVYFPNVNPIMEMVDMISASRAYEANIQAVETFKSMAAQTLRILA